MESKRSLLLRWDERYLRITQGMDSADALVVDGKVVAANAEERLNRTKHNNLFPLLATRACLQK